MTTTTSTMSATEAYVSALRAGDVAAATALAARPELRRENANPQRDLEHVAAIRATLIGFSRPKNLDKDLAAAEKDIEQAERGVAAAQVALDAARGRRAAAQEAECRHFQAVEALGLFSNQPLAWEATEVERERVGCDVGTLHELALRAAAHRRERDALDRERRAAVNR